MTNQLFPNMDASMIRPFSCGHIIPPSNILAVVVQKGPRGGEMEFKFQNRGNQTLVRYLAMNSRSALLTTDPSSENWGN